MDDRVHFDEVRTMDADPTRKLRADAQDNRDRMLVAARELFAERGLDVGMREIARRAAVGPATLYRRFPTRQTLIDEAFAVELRSCRAIVERGAAHPDAWHGLRGALEELTLLSASNRGFVDAFTATADVSAALTEHRRRLLGMLDGLARRAKAQGALRADFVASDLVLVLRAGRAVGSVDATDSAAAARRFVSLIVDGLRR
ncbi:helix-turn-helix domain-containing protein [Curtobacterium sp. MCLR17_007]|uniref:TetR/AcrR family transcriptional regulator n=1 Tax=Curtobacterium sp. MCLR17_007 TaxID=2175648 RepID=UPI0021ABD545|nr:TetR/AcrR family transcriptional regulator [Curtobacterium sp. MCLR17_007]WIB61876.1 helix-turn-helix domain-containing protein [Curtobacterium sp. MCLR17_007]